MTVAQDEYAVIDATVTNLTLGQEVTGANVAWRTDDADVAVVRLYDHDGDGEEDDPTPEVPAVFGVGPGTTNTVATYRGATSTIAVTVTADPITSGTLAATGGRTTIFEGDMVTLIPTFRNAANEVIDRPVTFVSSDETIATVDEDVVVTAHAVVTATTVTITATSEGVTKDVFITVVP